MEYFLVVYEESGDEIHFMLLEMKYYPIFSDFFLKRRTDESIDKLLEFVNSLDEKNLYERYFIQTYCNEEWPFNGYNIKRILSIPQFGM